MALRIASWNVNSVRQRVPHLQRFLSEQSPDVLCMQETKVEDSLFPIEPLQSLGYVHSVIHGQKGYNGVAIFSRLPFAASGTRVWCRKDDKRHAWVRFENGLELHDFYVPAGGDKPDPEANPKFDHKLRFLRAMARWCRDDGLRDREAILVGDLNVAPLETDVWNHKRLVRSVGHTPIESDLMSKLHRAGQLEDVPRRFVPPDQPLYSWWGYRFPGAFEKNYGWRLDHILATPPASKRVTAMRTVTETRTWEKPSDHVPVVVDLE